MTHMEAMAAIAQGVINIGEAERGSSEDRIALALIRAGSRIHRGMVMICAEEPKTIARLREALDYIDRKNPTKWQIDRAARILEALLKERTDPEVES